MVNTNRTISRREMLGAIGASGVTALAGCSGGDSGSDDGDSTDGTTTGSDEGSGSDSVTAAWVYISEVGDLGWSHAHDEGRKAVDEKYDWLETEYTEAVAPEDSERVFEQYAQGDADIVFGTTFGYQDPMFNIAEQYPDTYFEHATGYRTRENMGRYMGRIYQPRYLAGQAAGMVTENNTIGYVAAFPIPEVIRSINAMALGARSVNPDATFKIRWVNAWFDPQTSKQAANSLIDEGCDVISQEQDSPAPVRAANEADVWASGYNAPMGEFGGDNYLVSPVWNWEEVYDPTISAVRDGTWEADAFWGGMETNLPALDEWGPEVPQEVKDTVAETEEQIVNGELDVWAGSEFEGESDEFLFQEMNSFVDAVDADVPE
ncbi:glucose ABC transporter substrate-binding protein (plasmid) [Haloarcula hispanica N601]|uniref:Glucose ABC transporter substrate-binding protein n=2 Tax=Haloarcula hispanica TaxID=51589 RepID=V5TTL9_HALHI|nr:MULTISPECIES: BMP family ABC transporter substrate-binding protein [Haloarcula]AEM59436.1 basic membrane protein [Haloarcula hispanica ATCC 33960]AHB68282.1 glucose ABC transporter substrate-binding protein [Haloarcula hispanica N601]AJF27718.1 glucose ABC transporter substrate-binding protein [Haloarcula sp. CBA1115]KAA9404317.1 BMP family ABC transporter substrate-binding protein [Haloarcula sp. CBA1131]MUV49397.1 BMP family ABC transporter substrate-binding protein [Haloarcula sp. CBA112